MPNAIPVKRTQNHKLSAMHEDSSPSRPNDNLIVNDPIVLIGENGQYIETLNDLDLFEYFQSLDLDCGNFISESPSRSSSDNMTLSPQERRQISQWKMLQAVQLRLAYLRTQFAHRNSIHKVDRPEVYAMLRLANFRKVFEELKHVPKNRSLEFRPALIALARWRDINDWVQEAIRAVSKCQLLTEPLRSKLQVALQMVSTASATMGPPEASLADELLEIDQRPRMTIRRIYRSLRYLDQSCGTHLLEAEVSLRIMMSSILSCSTPPEGIKGADLKGLYAAVKTKYEFEKELLEEMRAMYRQANGGSIKNRTIQKRFNVGSDKAQALKDLMRLERFEKSPRRKRNIKSPLTP